MESVLGVPRKLIGSVIAKIFLISTNVARTNVAWTNVTMTVEICFRYLKFG